MARLRSIVQALRPEVEQAVEKLFGRTFFLDRPTVRRLGEWRNKAQTAAAEQAGYAYHGYAQVKFAGIVDDLAKTIHAAAPSLALANAEPIARHLTAWLQAHGLDHFTGLRGTATPEGIAFFRNHDITHRIRRLRLLGRRLTQEWELERSAEGEPIGEDARDRARKAVFDALSLYFEREPVQALGPDFPALAARVFDDPGAVLDGIAQRRNLVAADGLVDALLSEALASMPQALRRRMLLAYLGFPFYDTVTLPLLRGEGLTEFDPVKVDRISPDDCNSIRSGGAKATLRGVEFYNFGAFFSRAYRENDYLWGRLHGAERMIDLVASALPDNENLAADVLTGLKREAFLAILDEEEERLAADPGLVPGLRREVLDRLGDPIP